MRRKEVPNPAEILIIQEWLDWMKTNVVTDANKFVALSDRCGYDCAKVDNILRGAIGSMRMIKKESV